ncbi:hypothetical protein K505DRAFT_304315 [Melanomma pulvis-pyrius CBS 109.77]|uniref:Zn(2)-C6 fungal-type domain-containing protein n=1 Tax=Melanomma pulvis-pyrius CBS 109.77 TaxID=1314802 RepID=A0A6A6XEW7_9PLEO|nr:hypothetical protein K505DRAFT_304315 [Melanomma pulvis-pyrius CBS 109.77]
MASTAPPSSSNTTATTPDSTTTAQKNFSCVLCAQRKVKCDKRSGGCMNCAKARVPCIYKAPPPPRRRKKGMRDIDIHARLRLYEDALREVGIEPTDLENKPESFWPKARGSATGTDAVALDYAIPAGPEKRPVGTITKEAGLLISGNGKSRYLENGLWTSLKGEFRDSKDILDESSDEENYDARIIWIFTGVAGRIGQRIGLHRDGEILGLPPFEIEMRRRLWWQIMFLEGFAEKLAGTGGNLFMGDTKKPSNLNDSDLFQGMQEMPKEHNGPTEMMFFQIRCHVGEFLKRTTNAKSNFDGVWNKLSTAAVSLSVKDKAIDDLDAVFQRKFIQYCDHSIPWHFMCVYLAKCIIFVLRFIAHNAEQHTVPATNVSQSETDMLFHISLQVVSYQNMAYTTKEMQGFLWHINLNFQWKAFIYLVSQLRYRTHAPDADHAWKQVALVYEFHPDLAKEVYKRALPIAVGNLTIKAWDAFVAMRGIPEGGEPYFIQALRAQRGKTRDPKTMSQESEPSAPQLPTPTSVEDNINFSAEGLGQTSDPLHSLQWTSDFATSLEPSPIMPELPPLDPDNMNWSAWDNLVVDFQINETGFSVDAPEFDLGVSLASGDYSDLVITCGSDTYNVHRMIVCSRCEFFARAVRFSVGKESQDGKIDLSEDDPHTIKILMQYLYEGEYEPVLLPGAWIPPPTRATKKRIVRTKVIYTLTFPHTCVEDDWGACRERNICPHHTCAVDCPSNCVDFTCIGCTTPSIDGTADQLLLHAQMYEIGDKYDVAGLKELSKEKFDRACRDFWDDPAFPVAAHHAFSTTVDEDEGLRNIVSKVISSHMELLKKAEIKALMTEFNGLALGVLLDKAGREMWT